MHKHTWELRRVKVEDSHEYTSGVHCACGVVLTWAEVLEVLNHPLSDSTIKIIIERKDRPQEAGF